MECKGMDSFNGPIDMEVYRFNFEFNENLPGRRFYEFLKLIHIYWDDYEPMGETHIKLRNKLINYLWCKYRKQTLIYVGYSIIPLALLFLQGMFLEENANE
jgi:hypothetical protein